MKIADMRLRGVELDPVKRSSWLFVEVDTDDGLTGLGEAARGGDARQVAAVIGRQLKPRLLGRDPRDVTALFVELRPLGLAGSYGAFALLAVEQALWDLAAQAENVPIWRLLGGRLRERLFTYANISRATVDRSPDGFAAVARAIVARGFRAVKLAAFDDMALRLDTPEAFATLEVGIDRMLAVRESVGPDVQVMVDCHQRFNSALAIRVARRLEPVRLFWFEDPIARSDIDGMVRLRNAVGVPIATGETLFGKDAYWELMRRPAVDVLLPDVRHCGGIGELTRIAALAEPSHIRIAAHNNDGPVGMVASAHALATMPNMACLEFVPGDVEWRASLLTPSEPVFDGWFTVSDAPGLGVRLNSDVVDAHRLEW